MKKQPSCTWIEVNNEDQDHTFVVEDQDHPRMIEIHGELQRLSGLMHDVWSTYLVQNSFYIMWKKKRRYSFVPP